MMIQVAGTVAKKILELSFTHKKMLDAVDKAFCADRLHSPGYG